MEYSMKGNVQHLLRLFAITIVLIGLMAPAQAEIQLYFVHNDHLGTPQVVTDQNQQVVWEGRKKPFGETEVTTATINQPIRFPGQYFDEETGYAYNWFRYYDSSLGRYLRSDPIGLEGGLNTYGYALQNPLKYIDPMGLDAICGNDAVWIPDPNNPGHGYCKPTRDQGNQCAGGDCAAFPEDSNTQRCFKCDNAQLEQCLSNTNPSGSCAACAFSPNKAACLDCGVNSGASAACIAQHCSNNYKNCDEEEEKQCEK